jgi:hypothetical protein
MRNLDLAALMRSDMMEELATWVVFLQEVFIQAVNLSELI